MEEFKSKPLKYEKPELIDLSEEWEEDSGKGVS
jgi:hypothetical protein